MSAGDAAGFSIVRGCRPNGAGCTCCAARHCWAPPLFFISGLRYLPIAEASATGFVAPLFVHRAVDRLSQRKGRPAPLDRDRARLLGVIIILRPGTSAFHPAASSAGLRLAWACTLIMTRMMSAANARSLP